MRVLVMVCLLVVVGCVVEVAGPSEMDEEQQPDGSGGTGGRGEAGIVVVDGGESRDGGQTAPQNDAAIQHDSGAPDAANCLPSAEECDGVDDDCDGFTDEDLTRPCGKDTGACRRGVETCTKGSWGPCEGAIGPTDELCDGVIDEDCDNSVDEGCKCTDGDSRQCGTDVGACDFGIQECGLDGLWGTCEGGHDAESEVCEGSVDENCDGETDEGCDPCLRVTCYDGNDCTKDQCSSGYCPYPPEPDKTACVFRSIDFSFSGTCRDGECCVGCWDGAICQVGDKTAACGEDGELCKSCVDGNQCTDDVCTNTGDCSNPKKKDYVLCADGQCIDGTCTPVGGVDQRCRSGGSCDDSGLACVDGWCRICGGLNEPCCSGHTCDSSDHECVDDVCQPCGEEGQPCCAWPKCNGGIYLKCYDGICECGGPAQPCCLDPVGMFRYCDGDMVCQYSSTTCH